MIRNLKWKNLTCSKTIIGLADCDKLTKRISVCLWLREVLWISIYHHAVFWSQKLQNLTGEYGEHDQHRNCIQLQKCLKLWSIPLVPKFHLDMTISVDFSVSKHLILNTLKSLYSNIKAIWHTVFIWEVKILWNVGVYFCTMSSIVLNVCAKYFGKPC